MTTTVAEERVLIPNAELIRALREKRGWTIDDAVHHAKNMDLPLNRQTLRDIEGGAEGCRLATIGRIMKLYGAHDLDRFVIEVPEPVAKRKPRAPGPTARS